MIDKAALLAEIITLTAPPAPLAGDEITIREYAQAANCGRSVAQHRLDQLVAQGALTRRQASINGRPGWAYRQVE